MEIVETIMITETGKAGQNAHVLRKDQSSKTGTIVWNDGNVMMPTVSQ